jgi:hypothetical protein
VTQKLEKSLACAHSWDGSFVRSGTPNFPLLEEPSLTGPTHSPLGAPEGPNKHEGAPEAFSSTEYKAPPARANFGVVRRTHGWTWRIESPGAIPTCARGEGPGF